MPNQPKNPMLGWRPPAELSAWVRAEAKRRGVDLKVVLDEALEEYRQKRESNGTFQAASAPVPQARIDELRALAFASDVELISDPAELARRGIEGHTAEIAAQSQPAPCLHPSAGMIGDYCTTCKQDVFP